MLRRVLSGAIFETPLEDVKGERNRTGSLAKLQNIP